MSDAQRHPDGPSDGRHPDIEALADHQAGALDPPQATEVAAHVSGCARCEEDLAALEQVSARLGAAGDVGPMPDDVARQVAAALAAEGRPATVTIMPAASGRADPGRFARHNRVLQAAAAVVVVLAGSAIAVPALQGGGDSSDQRPMTAGAAADRDTSSTYRILATGNDYTQESLAVVVPRLIDAPTPANADGGAPEAADSEKRATPAPVGLDACITELVDDVNTPQVEALTPLLVDLASFGGRDARIVVLPATSDPSKADVFAVGPACGTGNADLLYFARVDRP